MCDMVTVQDIFTVQQYRRVLGSEDTEGTEVAAARPVVPPETAEQQTRASPQFLTRARAGCGGIHVRSRPAVTRFLELQYCLYQV